MHISRTDIKRHDEFGYLFGLEPNPTLEERSYQIFALYFLEVSLIDILKNAR